MAPREHPRLDSIDLAILAELQLDGRISNRVLARKVHLTEGPCLRRVQRLVRAKVVSRFAALVDASAVDRALVVFVDVILQAPQANHAGDFEKGVDQIDEITECYRLLGEVDYQLKVVAADLKAYDKLYMTKLAKVPGVFRMVSRAAHNEVKYTTALPLPTMEDPPPRRSRQRRPPGD